MTRWEDSLCFFDKVTVTKEYHMNMNMNIIWQITAQEIWSISSIRHARHESGERGRGLKSQLCEAEAREEPLLQLDPHWHVGEGLRVSETGGEWQIRHVNDVILRHRCEEWWNWEYGMWFSDPLNRLKNKMNQLDGDFRMKQPMRVWNTEKPPKLTKRSIMRLFYTQTAQLTAGSRAVKK